MDSKLPNVGTTIFAVMSQLANECGAINLSQGFPSFDPPQRLLDLITHYLNSGANQYAPMQGVPSLRSAVADKCAALYGRRVDADTEVTVCDGAT
ncbi:MAG: aminotransferase class I/II-fold pyridoxal phosphate-dependent enzyme, partial [Woeseiaceae bacterium]